MPRLGLEGAQKLARALEKNTTLKVLDLSQAGLAGKLSVWASRGAFRPRGPPEGPYWAHWGPVWPNRAPI